MSAQAQKAGALTTRLAQEHAAVAAELGDAISRRRRREALEGLLAQGLPTSRDENWRYASLRMLEKQRFTPVPVAVVAADGLPAPLAGFARLVCVDGVQAPGLSAALPAGVTVSREAEGGVERLPKRSAAFAGTPDGRMALLNEAFARDAIRLQVAGDTEVRLELLCVAAADATAGAAYPRVEIELEAGARAVLVERHVSVTGGEAAFVNAAVGVDLGRGARLQHHRLQQLGARAVWLDTLSAVLAPEAGYRLNVVAAGALAARSTMHVRLAGEQAQVQLGMASLADGRQVQDAYALMEHAAPRAGTEQSFRGISAGKARVGFNGKVIVQAGAQGTQSQQSLRGLLAGPEAEIDVRPQLEIYTDEVKAGHGATAGKLDETMLFYLLSRGLSRETAQQLLKWAFLEDVVSRIEVPELRRQIELTLAGQMSDAAALKELF